MGRGIECLQSFFGGEPAGVFRFGTAEVHSRLTNQFLVHNNSPQALKIQSVTPSCDCISIVDWPGVIESGSNGQVDILFVPDKVGTVDYRVYVKPTSPEEADIEFAIQGVVTFTPPARVDRDWSLYLGIEEAKALAVNPDDATWVDVRSPEEYARVRIPGSLQIPLYSIKTKNFLKGSRVVLVDEGYGSRVLEEEARKLREMGFTGLALWHGGLNAWQSRGGALEGNGPYDINRVPPVALTDIVPASDWLIVAAEGEVPGNMPEGVAIPFETTAPGEFISKLNSAISNRSQVDSVLIMTDAGENYQPIAAIAGQVNAYVFFLDGGQAAWQTYQHFMDAIRSGKTVKTTTTQGGGVRVRPGGCGGCPK